MDFSDKKIEVLCSNIEKYKKIDIAKENGNIESVYYDFKNLGKDLLDFRKYLIEGRRGSGKTALLKYAEKKYLTDQTIIKINCSVIREINQYDILIHLLVNIYEDLKSSRKNPFYHLLVKKRIKQLKKISSSFDEITFIEEKEEKIINMGIQADTKNSIKSNNEVSFNQSICPPSSNVAVKSDNSIESQNAAQFDGSVKHKKNKNIKRESSGKKVIDKKERLKVYIDILRKDIIKYKQKTNKGIILFIDDFFLIKKEYHPYIVSFFMDVDGIIKTDNTFAFIIATIPYNIKLTDEDYSGISKTNNFNIIDIDFSLMDIKNTANKMKRMLQRYNPELTLDDISNLFKGNAFNMAVVASAGVPRDFLGICNRLFMQKRENQDEKRISVNNIYNILTEIKRLKNEDLQNLNTINLPVEFIKYTADFIYEEVFVKRNTNVFLYPKDTLSNETDELIMNDLENARYIHKIADNILCKKTNNLCTVYFIDLTFYATGNLSSSVNYYRLWDDYWMRSNRLEDRIEWFLPSNFLDNAKYYKEEQASKKQVLKHINDIENASFDNNNLVS